MVIWSELIRPGVSCQGLRRHYCYISKISDYDPCVPVRTLLSQFIESETKPSRRNRGTAQGPRQRVPRYPIQLTSNRKTVRYR
ncbi:uncharacterized protein BDW70DRAFT_106276 [Aspergillus foveolatus]|uniref:uncharacterized protein n=1 Tax=Aspergillus foveolatus TaxID=210207 RepID=UPI003CCD77BD